MEINKLNQPFTSLETLILNLRKEDALYLSINRWIQRFMWAIAGFYLLMIVVLFGVSTPWYKPVGGLLVMLALVMFAILLRKNYREFKMIDYGLPTIEMLFKAANRYRLWQWHSLFILIPLLLEDIGLCLFTYHPSPNSNPITHIYNWQVIFIILLTIGFLIGYFIWRKRYRPLRDRALAFLEEIKS